MPNRLLVLPGYPIHRVDRPNGRCYGGVAVAAREDLSVTPLKPASVRPPDSSLGSIWTLLTTDRGRQLLLCSAYRPPRYTAAALDADFRDLELQLQGMVLSHPTATVLIYGDLNGDLLKNDPAPARTRLEMFLSEY